MMHSRRFIRSAALLVMLTGTYGCSGGHSGSAGKAGSSDTAPTAPQWVKGVFEPHASFSAKCANPRSGTHPQTGQPYEDTQGTLTHEKLWLRSMMHEYYLWYDEMFDINPAQMSLDEYLREIRAPRDRFSFSRPFKAAVAQEQGLQVDYGIRWSLALAGAELIVHVADVAEQSPYFGQIQRGDRVLEVDGIAPTDHDAMLAALDPQELGEIHAFTILDKESGDTEEIILTAALVEHLTVPRTSVLSTTDGSVGYLQFDEHLAKSEGELVAAVEHLRDAGINDLVLDLRYNIGGYLDIASELAYMIAGPGHTAGQIFYQMQYNDKFGTTDPFNGERAELIGFHDTTVAHLSGPPQALPTLNLDRVYVLTGLDTCSASEAVINGLEGIGVDVYLFGSETCGKPYGSIEIENCGTAYSFLMFKGANGQGYGDFTDGFWASGQDVQLDDHILPGCQLTEDLSHELGDPEEALLSAALHFRSENSCPDPVLSAQRASVAPFAALFRQDARAVLRRVK